MYYTECKLKNTKRGKPGNKASSTASQTENSVVRHTHTDLSCTIFMRRFGLFSFSRGISSIKGKLSKSGFVPHIRVTLIIPTTTPHSVGGHHLEGSGIPRYLNTWSSTKCSSLRVSDGVKNIKSILAVSINSFSAGILYAASFGYHRDLPSQMHMEYL